RNNTEAFIGAWSMVNAAGDIAVEAYAHEDILSIPAAVPASVKRSTSR
ncbi:MAG TPA: hypothetical protein GXZ82_04455, partial [Firmicutes bacterium]|nr:hypothetical protein [Bacillota bacterium]